ncbi:FtsX-like permease family protein [Paenibacillus sp. NPDC058174]|uniref:ABC transporter permease n=1 Tax=Paenibacillus sp. NPDC058174 TaxID=3346366 RepID=UPI0036D918D2
MTFRSLALSNIRGNWRSYSAFFWSSVFSVIIFYMYAAFIYHPDVINGNILQAQKIRTGMQFCLYLIAIFSFLFVLYANSAFLKTRKQEFGLFSLFGMTRSQLRRLVIYENAAVALLSLITGIAIGMLFSKLFFMALGAILSVKDPIPFAAPVFAIALTGIGFFALSMGIALLTSLRIGKSEIVDLLKAARKPKGDLVFSKWLVVLAVLCLGAAYGMALNMTVETFLLLALPILITVTIGTYFLFTQLSVLAIRFLQRKHSVFYNRTNMIVLSQLGYKLRDNARILFMVSIMSAVILTASGTFYLMQVGYKLMVSNFSPYTIAYVERGLHTNEVVDPEQMAGILEKNGHPITREDKLVGAEITKLKLESENKQSHDYSNSKGFVISASEYNHSAAALGLPAVEVEQDTVILQASWIKAPQTIQGVINGVTVDYKISESVNSTIMNMTSYLFTIIMDDFAYSKLMASIPEEKQIVAYGYEVKDWESAAEAVGQVQKLVPESKKEQTHMTRASMYQDYMQDANLTLFIGLFISLLFFIAAGSLIYFKLFTELQEDQQQFRALKRIGMTLQEIRRISVSQIAIVFYIPCVVGTIHALVAMKALDTLMGSSVWLYSFVVIGIFIIMQTFYFIIASVSYMKSINRPGPAS